jgi:carboxypeptidase Q
LSLRWKRILNGLYVRPKRTVRVALWTGEEEGLLGSAAYVQRHIAEIHRATTPEQLLLPEPFRQRIGPVVPKPGHALLSAVYNIDMGAGKIRGVTLSGNAALIPLFEQWIAPLHDLGTTLVTTRYYCPGDCRPFFDAGIPALSFVQDPLEYDTRTHHSNNDTYDHLIPEDLRQAATVLATLLYDTAMYGEKLPRMQ